MDFESIITVVITSGCSTLTILAAGVGGGVAWAMSSAGSVGQYFMDRAQQRQRDQDEHRQGLQRDAIGAAVGRLTPIHGAGEARIDAIRHIWSSFLGVRVVSGRVSDALDSLEAMHINGPGPLKDAGIKFAATLAKRAYRERPDGLQKFQSLLDSSRQYRPFVSGRLWLVFETYLHFQKRIFLTPEFWNLDRISKMVENEEPFLWRSDEATTKLVMAVLGEDFDMDSVKLGRLGRTVQEQFELEFVAEVERILTGRAVAFDNLQEAHRLIAAQDARDAQESLRVKAKMSDEGPTSERSGRE